MVAIPPSGSRIDQLRAGRHVPVLDGVRGIAILMVVAHHMTRSLHAEFGVWGPISTVLEMGWAGVDLFFVLSGFLITGILFDSKGSRSYFKSFYMRRVLRIFPLYYAAIIIGIVVNRVWEQGPLMGGDVMGASDLGGGLWFYMTNVYLATRGWGEFGYFDHFWSLAIEEHFYLVWPFLVFLCSRRRLMWISAAIVLVAFGLRVAADLSGVWWGAIYFLTPLRADGLAMGAFLALAVRGEGNRDWFIPVARFALTAAVTTLIGVVWWRGSIDPADRITYTGGYSLLAVAGGALLVLAIAAPASSWLARILTNRGLRISGKYSYGMYVLHAPIFTGLLHTTSGRGLLEGLGLWSAWGASTAALFAACAATALSFHLWEKQFLKLKRFYPSHDPRPADLETPVPRENGRWTPPGRPGRNPERPAPPAVPVVEEPRAP